MDLKRLLSIFGSYASEGQIQTYDEAYFEQYKNDSKRSEMYIQERGRIEALKPDGGRILDVGCGLGSFLKVFNAKKWDKFGVDVSDVAISEARKCDIKLNDFNTAYDYPEAYFDVIVFRGSLQLIPTPFYVIQTCIRLLKPGGHLIFLSTPNSNSPYYRRFGTLPFIIPDGHFLIPSDIMMTNALSSFGLKVIDIQYPYFGGPYASFLSDHIKYIFSFLGVKQKFPFWKSTMEVYAQKPVREFK